MTARLADGSAEQVPDAVGEGQAEGAPDDDSQHGAADRAAADPGPALAEMHGVEGEAAEYLDRAVSLYDAGPGPDEQHWFGGKALAGIDLAAIQLRGGALDAALAALESPLSLPAAQRINAVTTRLDLVRTELAAPVFQHSPQARELDERIEEFGQEAIAAELHSLSGGAG